MLKSLPVIVFGLFSLPALASGIPTHSELYNIVSPYLSVEADISVCVNGACEAYHYVPEQTRIIHLQGKMDNESLGGNELGATMGAIVSAVGKSAGAGGHVSVSYSTNTTTSKDGSKSNKTDVKVEVTVGTGAAAAPAAGGQ